MIGIADLFTALTNIAGQLGQLVQQKAQNPVPSYVFASLPSAVGSPGLIVFCTNGREPGQGVGAGTGMLAFSNGSSWRSTAGGALAS